MLKRYPIYTILLLCFSIISHAQYSPKWASYFGNDSTRIVATLYDPVNNVVYIAGTTTAKTGIATPGAYQTQLIAQEDPNIIYKSDLFLAQFDTSGNRIWATYYGGSRDERGGYISLDKWGNVYLSGLTYSENGIATSGSFMPIKYYASEFLVKFNASGQRLWGTYYGSMLKPNSGTASGVPRTVCDSDGNVYLSYSSISSDNLATAGSHRSQYYGTGSVFDKPDGYLVKFSPSGTRLWGTYLGGYGFEWVEGLSIDKNNNIYVVGGTSSVTDIATPGTFMPTESDTNNNKAFIMKFDSAGVLLWGTYLAGMNTWAVSAITDDLNNVYILGTTYSTTSINIATPGVHQDSIKGLTEVFLLKLNAQGQRVWGTYFGGEDYDGFYFYDFQSHVVNAGLLTHSKQQMAIIPEKNTLYLTAGTSSHTNIAFGCPYEGKQVNKSFLAAFNTNNGQLFWSSYHDAYLTDLSYDKTKREIYLSGWTNTDSIATNGTFQSSKPLNKMSGFITKVKEEIYCKEDTLPINWNNDILSTDTGYINYQWYRDGTLVQSGVNNNFNTSGEASGDYTVTATNNCGCVYSSNAIFVDNSTSIHNVATRYGLKLSPNPAQKVISINGQATQLTNWNYHIINTLGITVEKGSFSAEGLFEQQLNIEHLNAGVYYILLHQKNGSATLKFVKE